jgi:phosphoserine phosphatase RsbU/P
MQNFKMGLSLRYKLLFVLSTLPIVCLSLYLWMAMSLFAKDKIAYVFDSSATLSKSIATQTRMQVQAIFEALRPICESFDFQTHDFAAPTKAAFSKQNQIRSLVFFQKNDAGGFDVLGSLVHDPAKDQAFVDDVSLQTRLRNHVSTNISYMMAPKDSDGSIAVIFRAGEATDPHVHLVAALYNSPDLVANFEDLGLYQTFLMSKAGEIAVGSDNKIGLQGITDKIANAAHEGTAELPGDDGKTYLMSYAPTGIGDLSVVSYLDKQKALKAVQVLLIKSLMFFVALIASTIIISVIASGRLTATLSELFAATQKIAAGDFNVQVQSRSNDEIGGLAQSFTWMAAEVSRLMVDTAQKARMENELATVRTVQETLFPAANASFGNLNISGHFEPASECGGDWWSYSKLGDRIFLWIGDATGHGAPAALITSAARSAAAVVESFPDMTPATALKVLNHAIHQTSKGKINMTFFLAAFDLSTGLLTYCNASHDPPYLMKKRPDMKLKKKDLIPLMDVNGPRLGEKPDTIYKETSIQMQPGDFLFCYTDGILDIQNPALEKWGERTFLKTLIDITNLEDKSAEAKVQTLIKTTSDFRQGAELLDDVTLMMIEFQPAKIAKAA